MKKAPVDVDELRYTLKIADLRLSVLLKGFAAEIGDCYSTEHAAEIWAEMCAQIPPALEAARAALLALAPHRRRRVHIRRPNPPPAAVN